MNDKKLDFSRLGFDHYQSVDLRILMSLETPKDIQEWATVVRWVGNDAAHPNKDEVKKEDADDCLRLAEQFLHVIFVTAAIAKARRSARGKS